MNYPLIITGAGASYDFLVPEDYGDLKFNFIKWQPPTTNSLLDGSRFQELIDKYPEMDEIASMIRGKLRRKNYPLSFEDILTDIHINFTPRDPELHKGFVALLFYLSELFSYVTKRYYRQHNNYRHLKLLLKQSADKVLFVNFNYDLLLEKSIFDEDLKSIDDYVADETYKIIKIHGAYNWFIKELVATRIDETLKCYGLYLNNAERISRPATKDNHEIVIREYEDPKNILTEPYLNQLQAHAFYPALALPVIEKRNYICPENHIAILKKEIAKIDRVMVIGWRAGDKFMHRLLEIELAKRKIPVAFIGGSNARDVIRSVGIPLRDSTTLINERGFSDFISSGEGEEFIKMQTKK